MQNDRAEDTVNNCCNGLTTDEIRLVERIVRKVSEVSATWGLSTAPHSSLLRHVYERRLIRHLLPDAQAFLEIGPGAGYLSLMLAMDGSAVYNTDVSQAYYVFQHYLYASFDCLLECAGSDASPLTGGTTGVVGHPPTGKVQHLPWWIYKDLCAGAIAVDVIIVNHAICEMHPVAVQHLLAVAQQLGFPKVFMEGTGLLPTFPEVKLQFLAYGYSPTYALNGVYVFERQQSKWRKAMLLRQRIARRLLDLVPFAPAFRAEWSRLRASFGTLYRWLTGRKSRTPAVFPPSHVRYADYEGVRECARKGWLSVARRRVSRTTQVQIVIESRRN